MEATCGHRKDVLWVVNYARMPPKWIKLSLELLDARSINHRLVCLRDLVLGFEDSTAVLFLEGTRIKDEDLPNVAFVHMPNTSWSQTYLTAIRHLESMGVRCVNSSKAFSTTTSKYEQMRVLSGTGVRMPDTLAYPTDVTQGMTNMLDIPNFINFPAIIKHVNGNSGKRVILVDNKELAQDMADNLFDDGIYLLQTYVAESRAVHYRVMLAGDSVVGYFKYDNTASTKVQSNLFQGGTREEIEGCKQLEDMSLSISRTLGTDIVGIDYLKDKEGNFIFLEANASPAIANHRGVMDKIIDFLLQLQSFSDNDDVDGSKMNQLSLS